MRGARKAGIVAAAATCWLALAAPNASALTFTVNSTGDANDSTAQDNICDSDGVNGPPEVCTLRAALAEAEDDAGATADTVGFDGTLVGQTITLNSGILQMEEQGSTNGCSSALNTAGPCVGISAGTTALDALLFTSVGASSSVRGLAFTGFRQGILIGSGRTSFNLRNNYFGLTVAGADGAANTLGVALAGDSAVVGGPAGASGSSPADRNVFAGN